MSDTQSLKSEDSSTAHGSIFVEIEAGGKLNLGEASQKKVAICDNVLAALIDEITLVVGEIRPDRNSDDWILHGKTSNGSLNNGGRFLDLALVPGQDKSGLTMVLLGERKNKERFLATHPIKFSGRVYEIGEESSVFDKSNILGKGISQIATDQESIFTVSNLVRKIKLENGLKPTTARAQVPNDCLDGTLSLAALSSNSKKAKNNTIVLASRTKSAGKNKFAIEWYTCNKKDELTLIKGSSLRLHEDSEPIAILSDPKDGKSVFAVFNNKSTGNSTLVKLSKTSSISVPITTWNFLVASATMGMVNDSSTLSLITDNSPHIQFFILHKSDGHRGKQPSCNECAGLLSLQSPAHVISMATCPWRLSHQMLDELNKTNAIALASLCNVDDGSLVLEPESGQPYRIRAINCPLRGLLPEVIILEDLDRCFDGDFATLSNYVLKLCLSSKPCHSSVSLLSSWIKAEKLAAVEIFYINTDDMEPPSECHRLTFKALSWEKFRSLVTDTDWTTMINQRPQTALTESTCDGGTFTLEPPETNGSNNENKNFQRPMSASVCSSNSRSSFNSRIPMPKSSTMMNSSTFSNNDISGEDLMETNQRLRGLVQRLTATLTTILDVDVALRNNLMSMHEIVTEVQEELAQR